MQFKDFLLTESYKTSITFDDAIDTIKEKCTKTEFDHPLVRGMRDNGEAYIFEGETGSRKSITKSNYHNIILDHVISSLDKSYPLRSNSVICTTIKDVDSTDRFGSSKYVIFPYDTTIIGYLTKGIDLNFQAITINGHKTRLRIFKKILQHNFISEKSFDDIVDGINNLIDNPDDNLSDQYKISKFFNKGDDVKSILLHDFSKEEFGYDFGYMNDLYENQAYGECWIGGKCIALRYDLWEKLK